MPNERKPEDPPPVTEDIGLPTPPSPGRLPPPNLPPAPAEGERESDAQDDDGHDGG